MCNVYSNEKRWRAGDWALKSGGGGSEEAPLSSVTSAAAAAAVAVAAAATTPPQPRRATPGPARRRRRSVSTSPSCCCCCGRRCVSCCRRCRRCPVVLPRAVPDRRCRSSRSRTDDGYSLADRAAATTAARAAGTSSRRRPSGGAAGRGARGRRPALRATDWLAAGSQAVGPAHLPHGALTHCPQRLPRSSSS
ncbi:uncharacterized protein LOC144367985 [Ictidomys tridecemlineatus]